ncbi:enoyl-CoA hydratase/isomerase family protein [Variovorax sp. PCZ-1]|uniref:enoyl-CoA hydratase/isomerase family protein n=1 Tax=Variovorax sp. PCZ-1 TaxID=2835533 RepID=UPI001BCCE30C|nr:enoyl-CoA hydratase/isomerase family protein [Variovorax sp. PCZ-1]MBS7807127.1 enoyl-CoA hydratase/isomerase family protein [Variovorax sp. PCZ-1]
MSEDNFVLVEERGNAGLITLNRPKALNALSLGMVRQITAALLKWRDQANIQLVAIRGTGKLPDGSFAPFGSFCAGGDIRFFHQAALTGDPALEDFFTEEYSLNHLIHTYPKPYVAFMDGICMGGGMGISGHLAKNSIRIVTERTKMAMPETNIGLFPDVGGGYFLSRCANAQPGVGEYLALTGHMLHAPEAVSVGLADVQINSDQLTGLWDQLTAGSYPNRAECFSEIAINSIALRADSMPANSTFLSKIGDNFNHSTVLAITQSLEASSDAWAKDVAALLRKRSPLMLEVTLQLIRRARSLSLADDLRLERDLVRHCFHTKHLTRSGTASETVEGIRALAVDKDHSPTWNPARLEDITPPMIAPFFVSPWPAEAHPLRHLA